MCNDVQPEDQQAQQKERQCTESGITQQTLTLGLLLRWAGADRLHGLTDPVLQ